MTHLEKQLSKDDIKISSKVKVKVSMLLKVSFGAVVVLFSYLIMWPVAIDPADWTPEIPPSLTGKYQENTKLTKIETLSIDQSFGPEDIAVDARDRYMLALMAARLLNSKISILRSTKSSSIPSADS